MFKDLVMVKVTEQKQEKGTLLCIYDIPGNVMGSELDKFLCIAHLLLMGDGEPRHFYLQKVGPSSAPTGYSMFISNELLNGHVKFSNKETGVEGVKASDIVRKRFGAEYVDAGIKFVEMLKEWLGKQNTEHEWSINKVSLGMTLIHLLHTFCEKHHIKNKWLRSQDFQLVKLDGKTVNDALSNYARSCVTLTA